MNKRAAAASVPAAILEDLYPLSDDPESLTVAWLRRLVGDVVRLNDAAGYKGHELQKSYPQKIGWEYTRANRVSSVDSLRVRTSE